MHRVCVSVIILSILFSMVAGLPALSGRLDGVVTQVTDTGILATFPAAVKPGSAMMVMSGSGEAIAAMAISNMCQGEGPFYISGKISWIADQLNLKTGKVVYVNSINASAIPSPPITPRPKFPDQDLRFYYYSAAQNLGYGTIGLGIDRSLKLGGGMAIELDGAITGMGNVDTNNASRINTDCLIKNLTGRLNLELVPGIAVYGGYRWNEGRGNEQRWDKLMDDIRGNLFMAESTKTTGKVLLQGLEYGMTIRPFRTVSVSAGYIPEFRTDFGGVGICSEPAYTTELRFNRSGGAIRVRGLKTDSYWLADLGITIK